jgi:hypothetical protein
MNDYASGVDASSLSPDDVRAAAEVHRELGPQYSDAVVESFLEKVDREISARIDAKLASVAQADNAPAELAKTGRRRALRTGLAVGVVATGVPLTWLAVVVQGSAAARSDFGFWLLGAWLAIVVICAAVALVRKPRGRG